MYAKTGEFYCVVISISKKGRKQSVWSFSPNARVQCKNVKRDQKSIVKRKNFCEALMLYRVPIFFTSWGKEPIYG